MKRLFAGLLLIGSVLGAVAQTFPIGIYGTVTNQSNNNAIANHRVVVTADSNNAAGFAYFNANFTNSFGVYADTVWIPNGLALDFYVFTQDCQGQGQQALVQVDSNGNVTGLPADFSICVGSPGTCQSSFTSMPDTSVGAISFQGSANTNVTSWSWDFGDGNTGSGQTTTNYYNASGTYVVCLTTIDANNCTNTFCDSVVVSFCQADFTTYPDSALGPRTWVFLDLSQGSVGSRLWDFGDGNTSTSANPTHTYGANGTYFPSLTITDSTTGCISTNTQRIVIGNAPVNCQASFFSYPDSSGANAIAFSGSAAGTSGPVNWSWDFGDGNTGNTQYPIHTYATPGVYIACLTISDTSGCQDTYCDSVWVGGPPPVACQAQFTAIPNGLTVNFIDRSLPNASSISAYFWDFGDGNSSAQRYPVHTYGQPGSYPVCLIISTATGCSDTTCMNVNVFSSNFNVMGTVTTGGLAPADEGQVWLITFDSTSNLLTAIDSATIDSGGFFVFANLNPGNYTLKAALDTNSSSFSSYLPTYYGDSLFWFSATFFNVPVPQSQSFDINLIAGNNPGGPGFIGGNVLQGANKRDPGDPIGNIPILLLDMNDQPITYRYTHNDGSFEFDQIPFGTYKVYTEMMNKETIPSIVVLDASVPRIEDIVIEVGSQQVNPTSINPDRFDYLENVQAYPNPAGKQSWLKLDLKQSSTVNIAIRNAMGQVLYQEEKRLGQGSNEVSLDLSELSSGLYFLQIQAEEKEQTTLKLIKL